MKKQHGFSTAGVLIALAIMATIWIVKENPYNTDQRQEVCK